MSDDQQQRVDPANAQPPRELDAAEAGPCRTAVVGTAIHATVIHATIDGTRISRSPNQSLTPWERLSRDPTDLDALDGYRTAPPEHDVATWPESWWTQTAGRWRPGPNPDDDPTQLANAAGRVRPLPEDAFDPRYPDEWTDWYQLLEDGPWPPVRAARAPCGELVPIGGLIDHRIDCVACTQAEHEWTLSPAGQVYAQASQLDPWPGGWRDAGYTTDAGALAQFRAQAALYADLLWGPTPAEPPAPPDPLASVTVPLTPEARRLLERLARYDAAALDPGAHGCGVAAPRRLDTAPCGRPVPVDDLGDHRRRCRHCRAARRASSRVTNNPGGNR